MLHIGTTMGNLLATGPVGPVGAQGPIGPPGIPFTAKPDGHTLHLNIRCIAQGPINIYETVFIEVGRVLERLGIAQSAVTTIPIRDCSLGGMWLGIRFNSPDDAVAFRVATSHPYQVSVP